MRTSSFLAALWVALIGLLAPAAEAGEARRPNFLFLITDDQRWDCLGVVQKEQGERARFPWLRTPHLDRLAAEGTRFRNAFVVNSICSPSRASFLTGAYGRHHGIHNNSTRFPADLPTYASLLRKAGYTTGYIGKWHMNRQPGPRPGFDESFSYIGQGKYNDCPFDINGQLTETTGWVDDVATDYASAFLRKHRDKPFALTVGFKTAHSPFSPPKRLASLYEGEKARPVPNLDHEAPFPAGPGPEATVAEWFAGPDAPRLLGYMRCITAMDENVGRILGELERLGLAENTVVVFAGDNGFYLREHGLADKRTAYEESIRIPLLVRDPRTRTRGRVLDDMVLNIDLAPTFLELAGLPVPPHVHGRSWRPLLEGRSTDWRQSFFYEYVAEAGFASPHVQAVRTPGAKLIRYPGHPEWTEVFDLRADPYETRNLAGEPSKAELRGRLERDMEALAANFRHDR